MAKIKAGGRRNKTDDSVVPVLNIFLIFESEPNRDVSNIPEIPRNISKTIINCRDLCMDMPSLQREIIRHGIHAYCA